MNIWPAVIEQDFVYIEVGLELLFVMPVNVFIGANRPCVLSIWKLDDECSPEDEICEKHCPDQVLIKPVLELKL